MYINVCTWKLLLKFIVLKSCTTAYLFHDWIEHYGVGVTVNTYPVERASFNSRDMIVMIKCHDKMCIRPIQHAEQ